MCRRSWPEECEGNDGDAVGAAVGESAGVDDHPVDEAVAELFGQPVRCSTSAGLMVSVSLTSIATVERSPPRRSGRSRGRCSWCAGARRGRRLLRRRRGPIGRPATRPVPLARCRSRHGRGCPGRGAARPCRRRRGARPARGDQMVLGGVRESLQWRERGRPCLDGVEQEDPLEVLAVDVGGLPGWLVALARWRPPGAWRRRRRSRSPRRERGVGFGWRRRRYQLVRAPLGSTRSCYAATHASRGCSGCSRRARESIDVTHRPSEGPPYRSGSLRRRREALIAREARIW